MKKLIVSLSLVILFAACKKEDTSGGGGGGSSACAGGNLCFKMDGVQKTYTAKWVVIAGANPRNRISWEEGTGSAYKNVEIDIYGDTPGSYAISASPASGKSAFQYFEAAGQVSIQGATGTLQLDKNEGGKLSGKFTVSAMKGTTKVEITEGNFVAVPK